MSKSILFVTGFLVTLFMFSICEKDPTSSKIGPLYLIEVMPTELNVEIDSTYQFSAIGRDVKMNVIEDISFTWTSLYPTVGTVNQNGLFTALSSGTTFLTAKSETVESVQVTVSVYDPVFSIEILQDSLEVYIGETVQFNAVGKDMNGNNMTGLSFTWETGNTNIATINDSGVATGVSVGTTTVIAKLRAVESLPSEVEVKEKTTGTDTDIDGNTYQTVKIGDQWWMAENLNVTHYRNGDSIPNVTDKNAWENLTTGAYCNYNNDVSNTTTYGRLYNGYAVMDSRNIAPTGWHVPTDAEWKEMEMYLGMSKTEADEDYYRGSDEGGKLKESGTYHWSSPNTGATNESGFSALPGGGRHSELYIGIVYMGMGDFGTWWSANEYDRYLIWERGLQSNRSDVWRYDTKKHIGSSVRCVRD